MKQEAIQQVKVAIISLLPLAVLSGIDKEDYPMILEELAEMYRSELNVKLN